MSKKIAIAKQQGSFTKQVVQMTRRWNILAKDDTQSQLWLPCFIKPPSESLVRFLTSKPKQESQKPKTSKSIRNSTEVENADFPSYMQTEQVRRRQGVDKSTLLSECDVENSKFEARESWILSGIGVSWDHFASSEETPCTWDDNRRLFIQK